MILYEVARFIHLRVRPKARALKGFLRRAKDDVSCLKRLLPEPPSKETVRALLQEVDATAELLRQAVATHISPLLVERFETRFRTVGVSGKLFLYVLIRLLKPELVVETGCAKGQSSFYILSALERNGKGRLYTIDLPVEDKKKNDGIWSVRQPGVMVPPELRHRWTLILGDASVKLVPLLEELQTIGVFFHDSDHSYRHMMWEYTTVWPYLVEGGILVSDDIGANTAFRDFTTAMSLSYAVHRSNPNVGALRKPASPESRMPAPLSSSISRQTVLALGEEAVADTGTGGGTGWATGQTPGERQEHG